MRAKCRANRSRGMRKKIRHTINSRREENGKVCHRPLRRVGGRVGLQGKKEVVEIHGGEDMKLQVLSLSLPLPLSAPLPLCRCAVPDCLHQQPLCPHPVAQAVATAWLGPFKPCSMATCPAAKLIKILGVFRWGGGGKEGKKTGARISAAQHVSADGQDDHKRCRRGTKRSDPRR